jgi:hypothetical protein
MADNLQGEFKNIMKNLILGIIAIALFTILSCTSENQQKEEPVNSSLKSKRLSLNNLDNTKVLFETMIKSEDYKNYKTARTNFVSNMNGNLIFLKTKTEYINWINENLQLTKFSSVSDFEKSLDEMVSKQSILREKNSELYKSLDIANAEEYLNIIQSSLGEVPSLSKTNSCSTGCMNSCEQTLNNIESGTAFNQAMYGGNPFTDAIIDAMYWSMFESAINKLNSCMAGC